MLISFNKIKKNYILDQIPNSTKFIDMNINRIQKNIKLLLK